MENRGDIDFALRHTEILYVPDRRIDTFGDTRFNFRLVSEPLDMVNVCRIRSGWVETSRPRIILPADLRRIETDGFSPNASRFFEWMEANGISLPTLLRYGFSFSRSEVTEELVHDDILNVGERVVQDALHSGDSLRAVVRGVDDIWEVSLLRFVMEMIEKSHEIHIFDFKRRGML